MPFTNFISGKLDKKSGTFLGSGHKPRELKKEDLESVLNLSQRDAAKKLNISVSSLQRKFRHFFPNDTWKKFPKDDEENLLENDIPNEHYHNPQTQGNNQIVIPHLYNINQNGYPQQNDYQYSTSAVQKMQEFPLSQSTKNWQYSQNVQNDSNLSINYPNQYHNHPNLSNSQNGQFNTNSKFQSTYQNSNPSTQPVHPNTMKNTFEKSNYQRGSQVVLPSTLTPSSAYSGLNTTSESRFSTSLATPPINPFYDSGMSSNSSIISPNISSDLSSIITPTPNTPSSTPQITSNLLTSGYQNVLSNSTPNFSPLLEIRLNPSTPISSVLSPNTNTCESSSSPFTEYSLSLQSNASSPENSSKISTYDLISSNSSQHCQDYQSYDSPNSTSKFFTDNLLKDQSHLKNTPTPLNSNQLHNQINHINQNNQMNQFPTQHFQHSQNSFVQTQPFNSYQQITNINTKPENVYVPQNQTVPFSSGFQISHNNIQNSNLHPINAPISNSTGTYNQAYFGNINNSQINTADENQQMVDDDLEQSKTEGVHNVECWKYASGLKNREDMEMRLEDEVLEHQKTEGIHNVECWKYASGLKNKEDMEMNVY